MTSRIFAQALKSQAKTAFGNGSHRWVAPTLLTAGFVIGHSLSVDDKARFPSELTSATFGTFMPIAVSRMEQHDASKAENQTNDDNDNDIKRDQEHSGKETFKESEDSPREEVHESKNEPTNTDVQDKTADQDVEANEGTEEHDEVESENSNDDEEGGDEEEEENEDEDDDEPAPPKPLYEPVKGDDVSRKDLWDNFSIKAVRMTDEEFDDEEYDEDEDDIGDVILPVPPPVEL